MTPPSAGSFVVTGAQVRTTPRTTAPGDLYVVGARLTAGPVDTEAEVIRANGAYAVPLLVDSALAQLPSAQRDGSTWCPATRPPSPLSAARSPRRKCAAC